MLLDNVLNRLNEAFPGHVLTIKDNRILLDDTILENWQSQEVPDPDEHWFKLMEDEVYLSLSESVKRQLKEMDNGYCNRM